MFLSGQVSEGRSAFFTGAEILAAFKMEMAKNA
jgi:hypothetical protein